MSSLDVVLLLGFWFGLVLVTSSLVRRVAVGPVPKLRRLINGSVARRSHRSLPQVPAFFSLLVGSVP
jgi:hypothetical protein